MGNSHIKYDSQVRGKVHLNPAYLEVSNGTILEGSFTAEEQEQAGLGLEDSELTFDDGKVHSDLLAGFTQARLEMLQRVVHKRGIRLMGGRLS